MPFPLQIANVVDMGPARTFPSVAGLMYPFGTSYLAGRDLAALLHDYNLALLVLELLACMTTSERTQHQLERLTQVASELEAELVRRDAVAQAVTSVLRESR